MQRDHKQIIWATHDQGKAVQSRGDLRFHVICTITAEVLWQLKYFPLYSPKIEFISCQIYRPSVSFIEQNGYQSAVFNILITLL